jgi:hypothetical protein
LHFQAASLKHPYNRILSNQHNRTDENE